MYIWLNDNRIMNHLSYLDEEIDCIRRIYTNLEKEAVHTEDSVKKQTIFDFIDKFKYYERHVRKRKDVLHKIVEIFKNNEQKNVNELDWLRRNFNHLIQE